MGFNASSSTVTLTARLTPAGRSALISNNNALISSFSAGDSDANYNAVNPLMSGQVPLIGGLIGATTVQSNSTAPNVSLRSQLIVNRSGQLIKPVEPNSIVINTDAIAVGQVVASGTGLTQSVVDRNNYNTDPLVNLFATFGMPLSSSDIARYTQTTFANGGYADTALSALSNSSMIVMSIDSSLQGELLDGRAAQVTIPTTAGTYTLYSTFQNTGMPTQIQDANLVETSNVTNYLGNNIVFLFSDQIQKPNNNSALSWATGFGRVKPFTNNGKQQYNLQTNSNLGITADTIVGMALLDKGLLAIINPVIVNNFMLSPSGITSAMTLTVSNVSTNVYQSVTCILDRGEFFGSTNSSFTASDIPRISEIGLYDNLGNLIAVAKTDRHIVKGVNDIIAIGINIGL